MALKIVTHTTAVEGSVRIAIRGTPTIAKPKPLIDWVNALTAMIAVSAITITSMRP
ncbi:hypothetical protein [Flexivirga alba]|uniref:Uncharacterized protein n=1 Tax=Flexivirga alba TaxID=702742 RepID=A0ABW2AIX7_9MICO